MQGNRSASTGSGCGSSVINLIDVVFWGLRRYLGPADATDEAAFVAEFGNAGPELKLCFVARKIPHVFASLVDRHGHAFPTKLASPLLSKGERDALLWVRRLADDQQLHWLRLISERFRQDHVSFFLIKGLSLRHEADLFHPFSGDLDLLVAPEQLEQARLALVACGFRQGLSIWRGKIATIGAQQVRRIEREPVFYGQTWPYTVLTSTETSASVGEAVTSLLPGRGVLFEQGHLFMTVSADLHYSLNRLGEGAKETEKPGFSQYAANGVTQLLADELCVQTLNPSAALVFSASSWYHDTLVGGERSLKPLLDIVRLLAGAGRVRILESLVNWSAEYEFLRPSLYEVLTFLNREKLVGGLGAACSALEQLFYADQPRPYSWQGPLTRQHFAYDVRMAVRQP